MLKEPLKLIKMSGKKINNISEYWKHMDFDVSAYTIMWNTTESKIFLEEKTLDFIYVYILLTYKYGILLPNNIQLNNNLTVNISYLIENEKTIFPNDWINFSFNKLYSYSNGLLYKSVLFVSKNDELISRQIVNTDLLMTYEDFFKESDNAYAEPVTILFFKNYFYITFNSDAFFEKLNNRKTNGEIDNSETAYLNTPRFNSFLRDFIILCFQYGATDFEFEKLGYENISEKGVLFGNEIVYYEDIYDLLPEEHKYKLFEEVQVELDDTNYKKWLEKNKNN